MGDQVSGEDGTVVDIHMVSEDHGKDAEQKAMTGWSRDPANNRLTCPPSAQIASLADHAGH